MLSPLLLNHYDIAARLPVCGPGGPGGDPRRHSWGIYTPSYGVHPASCPSPRRHGDMWRSYLETLPGFILHAPSAGFPTEFGSVGLLPWQPLNYERLQPSTSNNRCLNVCFISVYSRMCRIYRLCSASVYNQRHKGVNQGDLREAGS